MHWVELDNHLGTLVPLECDANVSINEDPESGVSDLEARALLDSDWLATDELH